MTSACKKACFVLIITSLFTLVYGSDIQQGFVFYATQYNKDVDAQQAPLFNNYTHEIVKYTNISPNDFPELFLQNPQECALLCHLELFVNKEFCIYARRLPIYKNFMLALQKKVHKNKSFVVHGFKCSYCFGKVKNKFCDFVNAEVDKIQKDEAAAQKIRKSQEIAHINYLQSKPRLHVANTQEIARLYEHCTANLSEEQFEITQKILADRINAIEETNRSANKCFDYASKVPATIGNDKYASVFENTYGTQLDCQLHKELCQTRLNITELECKYPANYHIQLIAPWIDDFIARAKGEQSVTMAFQLSDFCRDVTDLFSDGMHVLYDSGKAIVKGLRKTAKEITSAEHWKNMAKGFVLLAEDYVRAIGTEEAHQHEFMMATLSKQDDAIMKLAEKTYTEQIVQINELLKKEREMYNKICNMTWQKLLENGTEIGTTMCLDIIALNFLGGYASTVGRKAISEITAALKNAGGFNAQSAVEIAGFGKLIGDEGCGIVNKIKDAIENDFALFAKDEECCVAQAMQKLAKEGKLNKGIEQIFDKVKSYEQARNKALEIAGDLGADSKPYIGRLLVR